MKEKHIPFKNVNHEIQLTTQRAWTALLLMAILASILICRLAYLQIHKNQIYKTKSINNAMDLVPLEPTRGLIYDRRGILLADNIPVFSLDVIPEKTKDLSKMLAQVSKIVHLSDSNLKLFRRQLKQHRRFEEIPLKLRLTENEVIHFTENQHRFPGFMIKARLIRHYPFKDSFSHVLGYVGQINSEELKSINSANYSASQYIGKLGVEKYFEEELHGTSGYQEVEVDANGHPVRILKNSNPVPGKNLFLSIDSDLQLAAEKALADHRGAIVAIQPSTGQVLALVSLPSYDPNLFVVGISTADFKRLEQSADHPLYNRAVRGLYPPASTVKPYMALQGLDSKVVSTQYTVFDPGWFMLENSDHVFRDMRAHGNVNLSRALITSCDVYFYNLAHKLGIKRIHDILRRFGFGETSGIEMEEEVAGTVSSPEWKRKNKKTPWYQGDTIISGIGQGYMQATPLQMAVGTATLANRGKRFVPSLLLGEQESGKPFEAQAPVLMENITLQDDKTWDIVIQAMQKVVDSHEGTAWRRFGSHPGYDVAAKTGTAQVHAKKADQTGLENQKALAEKLRDHGLFIAFAPVKQPKIAIAVIIENDRSAAVPTAKRLLNYYMNKITRQKT